MAPPLDPPLRDAGPVVLKISCSTCTVAMNSTVDILVNKPSADDTVLLSLDSADNFSRASTMKEKQFQPNNTNKLTLKQECP